MTFDQLIDTLASLHERYAAEAVHAVNLSLTLRNWTIGYYLVEFEQSGADRAAYGKRLLQHVSEHLTSRGLARVDPRELRRFRQLYLVYPRIRESLRPDSSLARAEIRESATPESRPATELGLPTSQLLSLSFTHLAELIRIDDPLKRLFYEVECHRGGWSVRELKRQIASLYYERSDLSRDKSKLANLVNENAETATPVLAIRDPYVFEFLGLEARDVMGESELENALLDKLQDFLLELGHGFCFEARQRRILIGGEHFFVDLVFYQRILKCHVLVELKVDGFRHEHIGQLNTYVNWYRENVMRGDDNPPIGILLCTDKNQALMEYALAGMANQLFVSKYQLELPNEAEMRAFLEDQLRRTASPRSRGGPPSV